MFFKRGILKNFAIFPGKRLYCSLFSINLRSLRPATLLKRDSNTSVSWEYGETFKNTSFEEHLRTTAADVSIRMLLVLWITALTLLRNR